MQGAMPLTASRAPALAGTTNVPGDKSISHRALLIGALATGRTVVTGLLEAEDVLNTAKVAAALGAGVTREDGTWVVRGLGVGGLQQPDGPLDFGNSGTGARLGLGVIAGNPITAELIGDESLSRRPMGRVLKPLKQMGLEVLSGTDTLPLKVRGTSQPIPIRYELPVASAQLKSAILLAGLASAGETTVISEPSRDHTERMLRAFGGAVESHMEGTLEVITLKGQRELAGRDVIVPGDPSSAAFLAAAALVVPGSEVVIENVLVNETRIGFYDTLREMGADVSFVNERDAAGEPVADIRVRAGRLKGVRVPPERAPSMIDEYPILAVVAAFADGETRMEGLAELKVKESDRLAATAAGLAANGVDAEVEGDTLIVRGRGRVSGGGTVVTHLDHRIAMSFLVMGQASEAPVTVDDTRMIATSFPEFRRLMEGIGAIFREA
ncbi:MAG: 3-phosphoshikimate 1-carboxyvinyltransferase [Pseudomonadota bacterium]|jgi:3-phosphoshikimate 1-carboxyvinyltransferase